jgi:DNA-binding MarR family transcriptional regulator
MWSQWLRTTSLRYAGDMIEEVEALFSELFEAASVGRRSGAEIAAMVGQTQARWQTLWTIGAGSLTVPQVARRLGVTRQSVQRLANELADEGLLNFVDNPDHKTSPLVRLTDQGRAVLDEINAAGTIFNTAVLEDLGPERVRELRELLRDFITTAKANLSETN